VKGKDIYGSKKVCFLNANVKAQKKWKCILKEYCQPLSDFINLLHMRQWAQKTNKKGRNWIIIRESSKVIIEDSFIHFVSPSLSHIFFFAHKISGKNNFLCFFCDIDDDDDDAWLNVYVIVNTKWGIKICYCNWVCVREGEMKSTVFIRFANKRKKICVKWSEYQIIEGGWVRYGIIVSVTTARDSFCA
jgi:hypothetical protein